MGFIDLKNLFTNVMTKSRWTWCINYQATENENTLLNISIALEILFDVSVVEVEMGFPFHEGISNLH